MTEESKISNTSRLDQFCAVIDYFRSTPENEINISKFAEFSGIAKRTLDNHIFFLRRLNEKFGNPLPSIQIKKRQLERNQSVLIKPDSYYLVLALLAKLGQGILSDDGSHSTLTSMRQTLLEGGSENDVKSNCYTDLLSKIYYKSSEFDSEDTLSNSDKLLSVIDRIILISEFLMQNRLFDCVYSNKSGKNNSLQLLPLTLLRYNESWYLIAAKPKNLNSFRMYKVSRISAIQDGGQQFETDKKAVAQYMQNLDKVFGIDADLSQPVQTAIIRFSGDVRHLIKGVKWAKGAVYNKKDDLLSVKYINPGELLGRILRYGEYAEVLEPAELRELWLARIRAMAEKFLG